MDTLTERFIKGLKEHNLTPEILKLSGWKYCGGNQPGTPHFRYWKLQFGNRKQPEAETHCICGHKIRNNCFITDGEKFIVLGNCCIKKFVPKSGRTCEQCGEPHKNRIVNRCNECRNGLCDYCGKTCGMDYTKCYHCSVQDFKLNK
jgi:hypothetical protein